MGDIENREALKKGNAAGFSVLAAGRFLLALGREAVRKNYGRAVLALADIAAHRKRLFEGQPAVAVVSPLKKGVPQKQKH